MQSAVLAAAPALLVTLLAVLLASFYFLERLIRYEYAAHRDAWEHDGRPNGFFFRPPDTTWLRSGMAFQRCALGWPFYTPSWVRGDPAARTLHRRMRWCLLIWNVGIITFFVFVFPHMLAA